MFAEKMNEQTVYCEQCSNHCPINELKCNRGRSYFGQEEDNRDNRSMQKRQRYYEKREGYGRRNHEKHGEGKEHFGHERYEASGINGRHRFRKRP